MRAGEGGLRIPEDIQLDEIEEKTYWRIYDQT